MSTYKLHPLHTIERVADSLRNNGVFEAERCTGRSTQQALRYLADAMANPGTEIVTRDHASDGKSLFLASALNAELAALCANLARKAGLEHIWIGQCKGTIVFERRPNVGRPVLAPESGPAPQQTGGPRAIGPLIPCHSAESALQSRFKGWELIRQIMRQHGVQSATTLHGDLTVEGQNKIVFSPVQ